MRAPASMLRSTHGWRCEGGSCFAAGFANYNATEPPHGPRNYLNLLIQRGRMEGFIIFDYVSRFAEGIGALSGWVQAGKLKYKIDVQHGLEHAPATLRRLCTLLAFTEQTAEDVGRLLARSRTSDVVDTAVIVTAIEHNAAVLTSDPKDLAKLTSAADYPSACSLSEPQACPTRFHETPSAGNVHGASSSRSAREPTHWEEHKPEGRDRARGRPRHFGTTDRRAAPATGR